MTDHKIKASLKFGCVSLATAAIVACGGGGGGGGGGSSTPEPSAPSAVSPQLTVSAIKTFTFSWQEVADTDYYRILENPDGQSGFSQLGSNITQTTAANADGFAQQSASFEMPVFLRHSASYIIESCNDVGCTSSTTMNVTNTAGDAADINAGVGYFKASNAEEDDGYTNSADYLHAFRPAFNSDASRMVYGAPKEDGNGVSESDNSVSDSGAVYVFDKDDAGQWTQTAYIKAPTVTENAWFGSSVAMTADGSTIAVGAAGYGNTGIEAYVYQLVAGSWTLTGILTSEENNASETDGFGADIDISDDGSLVAIGALKDPYNKAGDNVGTYAGSVYLFEKISGTWSQKAYLKPDYQDASDVFGKRIDLTPDGRYLAVGANGVDSGVTGDESDNDMSRSGAVYIYENNNGNWGDYTFLQSDYLKVNGCFGGSVALNSDATVLATGAYCDTSRARDINGDQENEAGSDVGAVFIYTRSGTTWTKQAYLKASNASDGDNFGFGISLSGDGDILAVSAYGDQTDEVGILPGTNDESISTPNGGSFYIFENKGNEWQQSTYIQSPSYDNPFVSYWPRLSRDGSTLGIAHHRDYSTATGVFGVMDSAFSLNDSESVGAVLIY